jgi:hypothetical protein
VGVSQNSERVVAVPIKPGIFVLRYVSAATGRPPRIFVNISPSSSESIDVIFVPGKAKGVLEEPRDYALVVAGEEGRIQLTVVSSPGGDARARVQVEPLKVEGETTSEDEIEGGEAGHASASAGQGFGSPEGLGSPEGFGSPAGAPPAGRFSLICHVAKRGDVQVGSDAWVGGPDAPAAIEGLAVHWSPPRGVLLEYQVLVQGGGGRWSSWAQAGEFAGSRGRGRAILGLRVRLSGGESDALSLSGEALFFACPAVSETGRELEFTSYAGVDPLVGLRLGLEAPAGAMESVAEDMAQNERPVARNALRVFKSPRASGGAEEHQDI